MMQTSGATAPPDDDGLGALVERAVPQLYRYVVRLTGGDRALAEDLVQEACLELVRSVERSEPGAHGFDVGWLVVVARRRFLDHLRRSGREEGRLRRVAPVTELHHDPEPTGEALAALGRLPDDQRMALVLRYVDDLPVAEVAGALHRSVAATESLLARGRRALARLVEEDRRG